MSGAAPTMSGTSWIRAIREPPGRTSGKTWETTARLFWHHDRPVVERHGTIGTLAQPRLAGVGGAPDHGVDVRLQSRGERPQHVVGEGLARGRRLVVVHAEAQPRHGIALQVLEDRLEPAVTAGAAALAQAQLAQR